MSHCVCLNPTIIYNKSVYRYAYKIVGVLCCDVYTKLSSLELDYIRLEPFKFNLKYFPPASLIRECPKDYNYEDYKYVLDDGTLIDAFISVPCGKCEVCRSRVVRDWVTRCICETSTSNYIPFFVTLTYNNDFVPVQGVDKTHIQKFFKRLRMSVGSLRYIVCSEYGKNTLRPHYHAVIWFDRSFSSCSDILHIIEDAWSEYNFKLRQYVPFGFVYVRPCDTGGFRYTCKYLYKTSVVPYGCNETFFLSSRRPAIGRNWIDANKAIYLKHIDLNDVSVFNRCENSLYNAPLPSYYRSLLYPSFSRLLGSLAKPFKRLRWAFCYLIPSIGFFDLPCDNVIHYYDWFYNKFDCLRKYLPSLTYLLSFIDFPKNKKFGDVLPSSDSNFMRSNWRDIYFTLLDDFDLFIKEFDGPAFEDGICLHDKHSDFVKEFYLNRELPPGLINSRASRIRREKLRSSVREIL